MFLLGTKLLYIIFQLFEVVSSLPFLQAHVLPIFPPWQPKVPHIVSPLSVVSAYEIYVGFINFCYMRLLFWAVGERRLSAKAATGPW